MKRLIVLVAFLVMLAMPALANSWGTKGNLTTVVGRMDELSDYSASSQSQCVISKTAEAVVMQKDYKGVRHNVLLTAVKVDGKWQLGMLSTTAVPQPAEDQPSGLKITLKKDGKGGFTLYNPVYERNTKKKSWQTLYTEEFHFAPQENTWVLQSFLTQADGVKVQGQLNDEGYQYTCDGATALWQTAPIGLEAFNHDLLPRTVAEIEAINAAMDYLPQTVSAATYTDYAKVASKGTAPVYSAPDDASWRSGSGKAAVGLKGSFRAYATDGAWTLIEYESSLKTHRVGYMLTSTLGDFAAQLPPVAVGEGLALQTARETWLTDDPLSSQYRQFTLAADAPLRVFSRFDPYYAYVETQVNGQRVRGFVPLADIAVPADVPADDLEIVALELVEP